jgi:hypothetical protein
MSNRPTAVIAAIAAARAATLMAGPAASASRQQPAMHWSASWTSAIHPNDAGYHAIAGASTSATCNTRINPKPQCHPSRTAPP